MPDTPVTERMCKERYNHLAQNIEDLKVEVIKLRLLWQGNGKVGAGHKVNTMWDAFEVRRQSSQGMLDWIFRAVVMILITYIAVKLGLK